MSLRTVAGANIRFFRKSNNPAAIFLQTGAGLGLRRCPRKGRADSSGLHICKNRFFSLFLSIPIPRHTVFRQRHRNCGFRQSPRHVCGPPARPHSKINYGLRRKTQNNNPPKSQDECRIPKERRRTHTTQCTKAIPQCDDFRCSSLYVSCRCYATATASVPA